MAEYFMCHGCKRSVVPSKTSTLTKYTGKIVWWCPECIKVAENAIRDARNKKKTT